MHRSKFTLIKWLYAIRRNSQAESPSGIHFEGDHLATCPNEQEVPLCQKLSGYLPGSIRHYLEIPRTDFGKLKEKCFSITSPKSSAINFGIQKLFILQISFNNLFIIIIVLEKSKLNFVFLKKLIQLTKKFKRFNCLIFQRLELGSKLKAVFWTTFESQKNLKKIPF